VYRYFLSWRYLRRRRTNLIGIVGLFVAVGALIMILSIMTGFLEQSRTTMRGSLSDVIILPRFDDRSIYPRDPQPLLEAIRADRRVAAASAHLSWLCILTRDDELSSQILSSSQYAQYAGIKLTGIDVADEFAATEFKQALTRERRVGEPVADPDHPFAPPPEFEGGGRPRASVVVGEQMFANHRLRRGSLVTLMTAIPDPRNSAGWSTVNRQFVVAGTFRTTENETDLERIYVERGQLARLLAGVDEEDPLPRNAQQYSELLVRLHDYERDGRDVVFEFERDLPSKDLLDPRSDVLTWEDFRHTLLGAIENERVLMAIMLSLVLLVAGFTIFAILSMMVTEKRRDIGILTALGATPRGVLMLFLMIGFWDALLGATAGAIAGIWAALRIDAIERWLSGSCSDFLSWVTGREVDIEIFNRNVYIFDTIPSIVQPVAVATIVLGAFVCTLLFAAIPAWKAATMDPVEALRFE
jgi:ABC-type lipoprotein release transport system permease subunit